jgi:hypothetical protein
MEKIKLEIKYRFRNHPEPRDLTMHLFTPINVNLDSCINPIYINKEYCNDNYKNIFEPIIKLHFNQLSEIISINYYKYFF